MNELYSFSVLALTQEAETFIGFLVLLGVLLLILFRGSSRSAPTVIENDPPRYPAESPYHESNRRKAAAAAFVAHTYTSKGDPS